MVRRGLPLVLVVVLLPAIAASAPPPQPLPAHNGWIAFASDRGAPGTGQFRLHRLEPLDGRVTALGVSGRQPAWSPDGTLLAFVQDRFKLVVTRPDGTRVKVFDSDYPIADPAWSPDGSRLVVKQTIGRRFRSDLAIVDTTKSTFARITRTSDDDSEPSWSQDGTWIAFVSDRAPEPGVGDTEIYLLRPDGRQVHRITSNDFEDRSPAWSPEGSGIAFVSGAAELWTMKPDGSDPLRVQPASAPGGSRLGPRRTRPGRPMDAGSST